MSAIMGSVNRRQYGIASGTVATMRLLGQMFSMAIATVFLAVFIGRQEIRVENYPLFQTSMQACFTLFLSCCAWSALDFRCSGAMSEMRRAGEYRPECRAGIRSWYRWLPLGAGCVSGMRSDHDVGLTTQCRGPAERCRNRKFILYDSFRSAGPASLAEDASKAPVDQVPGAVGRFLFGPFLGLVPAQLFFQFPEQRFLGLRT
jgi:hypothetical protein